jgi:hypothetical protein
MTQITTTHKTIANVYIPVRKGTETLPLTSSFTPKEPVTAMHAESAHDSKQSYLRRGHATQTAPHIFGKGEDFPKREEAPKEN